MHSKLLSNFSIEFQDFDQKKMLTFAIRRYLQKVCLLGCFRPLHNIEKYFMGRFKPIHKVREMCHGLFMSYTY